MVFNVKLTFLDDLIKLIVNGETMQSLKPENSVKLLGGGKVQVSHDSECNRKCERTRGDLDARIEVKQHSPVSIPKSCFRISQSGARLNRLKSWRISLLASAWRMESWLWKKKRPVFSDQCPIDRNRNQLMISSTISWLLRSPQVDLLASLIWRLEDGQLLLLLIQLLLMILPIIDLSLKLVFINQNQIPVLFYLNHLFRKRIFQPASPLKESLSLRSISTNQRAGWWNSLSKETSVDFTKKN